jgi:tetratricopeptide (TPR) repeat protein
LKAQVFGLNKPKFGDNMHRISVVARKAARVKNWGVVNNCTREILKQDKRNPEGWFLSGLLEKAAGRNQKAIAAFSKSLQFDAKRYDAAIELANLYLGFLRHRDAAALLQQYESSLGNSPYYLDMAATIYTMLGLHSKAWPLYLKANELQPEIDRFQASLAACAVLLGKINKARLIYLDLLKRHPYHQRNHYQLSLLEKAKDSTHVEQMDEVLKSTNFPPEKNIYLYYALGKELEDLDRWEEAFHYYKLAGDAAAGQARAAGYDVGSDIDVIDKMIEVCNSDWLATANVHQSQDTANKIPIFIVGLPRTGTTLTERIIASHSKVESADETFFMRIVIKRVSGITAKEDMSPAIIEAAAKKDIRLIASGYRDAVDYRLGSRPMFIDKLPENALYLGFIAKAFPEARIIHLRRNPMDACFAMYKQSYFRQAYRLEDLGRYYVAYDRLYKHWKSVLKERFIEVNYESLVSDLEGQAGVLLDKLGLDFEQACIDFHLNKTPSATASNVQVREKAHTRSIKKWKNWESQLQALRDHLENAGISTE